MLRPAYINHKPGGLQNETRNKFKNALLLEIKKEQHSLGRRDYKPAARDTSRTKPFPERA